MITSSIILKGPYDWDAFEQAVVVKAATERILHLIQLKDTAEFNIRRRKPPMEPEYSQYKAKVPTPNLSSKTSFERGKQPANSYNELVDEDKEAYKFEQTAYHALLIEFNREADGICNVMTWIIDHINPSYTQTCSPTLVEPDQGDNICVFVDNLRKACGVTDAERRIRARQAYLEALREAESAKTDWQKWITNWEHAITIARQRKVSQALSLLEWFDDLERHLNSRFEMLLRLLKSHNKAAIDNDSYEPAAFSTAFREEIQNNRLETWKTQGRRRRRCNNRRRASNR